MSAEAVAYVTKYSPYTGNTFVIHLMIADVVNDTHGNEFFMATDNLARKSRASKRTAQRAIDTFVADGFLTLKAPAKQHYPAVYQFVFRGGLPVVYENSGVSESHPSEPVDNFGSGVTFEHSGVTNETSGVTSCPPEVTPCHPNSNNSNNSIELNKHTINEVDQPNLFNDFWEQYPRKVGKQKAEKAFNKLDATTQQDALEGITRYTQFWEQQQTALEYIPHPTTWINAARWQDELSVTQIPASHSEIRPYDQPTRPECPACDSTGWTSFEDDQGRYYATKCEECNQ